MRIVGLLLICLFVASCGGGLFKSRKPPEPTHKAACPKNLETCLPFRIAGPEDLRPRPRSGEKVIGPSLVSGTAVEEVDKTSEAEIVEARKVEEGGGEKSLGTTIASLGDVTEQGFWLKTTLVRSKTEGRILWRSSGATVNVDLLPLAGDAGAGSQISLAAMRELGVPLTELAEFEVFARAGG